MNSQDLTGYYGLSQGDLIKVRVKAISSVDTESQWSQNYTGAYVQPSFDFNDFDNCIDNWESCGRLRGTRLQGALTARQSVLSTQWDTEIFDYINIVRTTPGELEAFVQRGID